jgi:hypothetical protein
MWLPLCQGDGDLVGAGSRASGVHTMIECRLDKLDHRRSIEHHEYRGWAAGRPVCRLRPGVARSDLLALARALGPFVLRGASTGRPCDRHQERGLLYGRDRFV